MGKTYTKQSRKYDDEISSGRSGKHSKHSNNRKTGGMKTLNSYAEDDYDDFDLNEDAFDDEFEISDEIYIQHTKNKP
jgi:hypothetical protein